MTALPRICHWVARIPWKPAEVFPEEAARRLAEAWGLTVMGRHGDGRTEILILGESHLALHFFPEFRLAHLDLVLCGGKLHQGDLYKGILEIFGESALGCRITEVRG